MPDVLCLDLSKRAAGWARWRTGQPHPAFGTWTLGSAYTSMGRTFVALHRHLHDQFTIGKPDLVVYEEPLLLGPAAGNTTADTQKVLIGLAAHCESYCDAKGTRCFAVNMSTWRRMFIGSMKRGTERRQLKDYVIARCRELGLKPDDDNQADAIGILAHTLQMEGIDAPWAVNRLETTALGRVA